MTREEIAIVLVQHAAWKRDESGGARANLRSANLNGANLHGADLSGADLRSANLHIANLRSADLSYADLNGAKLSCAKLSCANLSGADLSGVDLSGADLSGVDLSGAKGLLRAAEWLNQFEHDSEGVIVYKAIGGTDYPAPAHWTIEPGAVLTEEPAASRTQECGCGVNFGTREFVDRTYRGSIVWRCRIAWIDLADVCVPYNTNGKARCARLTLLDRA